jgi:salicylate synthase
VTTHIAAPPAGRYLHTRVSGRYDPPALAVRLARSGLFEQHVVYEAGDRWWFAGGVLGSVTVHRDAVRAEWSGQRLLTPLAGTHPIRALGEALRQAPFADWRAYGWVAFESALVGSGRPAHGDQPLAYLVIPRLELEIGSHTLDLRCADPVLLEQVLALAASPDPAPTPPCRPVDVEAGDKGEYLAAVAAAVARIKASDLAKVILSRRVEVPFTVDFPATFLAGRRANTPARSFLLDLPGLRAAGFSPETVAEVSADGWVTAQPLAGTRARSGRPETDSRLRSELLSDPKEVYEHAVSVQLADTELRGLCAPGTVSINEFMAVKERGSVHHLGSRVRGRLRADRTAWDALAVLFPAVTASGVPKAEAYDLIAAHEPARGLYAGAVLRSTRDGDVDAALVLRTVFTAEGRTWLRAGAGIVAASQPEREYRETCEKLASIAPFLVPTREDWSC